MSKEKEIIDIVICSCHSDEHQIIFKYDKFDHEHWEDVYMSYHLEKVGFWRRVKNGFKYIFGYRSKYGHWGELILKPNDETIEKFENVVKKLKDVQKHIKQNEI